MQKLITFALRLQAVTPLCVVSLLAMLAIWFEQ